MTYPDGRTVSYTYDLLGRMTSVIGLDGEVTEYTYDANGRRIQTASDTLTTDYTYDNVGNLIRQETSGESDISFAYSYDRNGFITEETRMENGTTVTSNYAYDPLGELISFTQSTGYGESYTVSAQCSASEFSIPKDLRISSDHGIRSSTFLCGSAAKRSGRIVSRWFI